MKKKNRSSGGLNYFTSEHEQAILDYVSCLDKTRRDFLYKNYIMPVFCEMVDKIVFTYKFNTTSYSINNNVPVKGNVKY